MRSKRPQPGTDRDPERAREFAERSEERRRVEEGGGGRGPGEGGRCSDAEKSRRVGGSVR